LPSFEGSEPLTGQEVDGWSRCSRFDLESARQTPTQTLPSGSEERTSPAPSTPDSTVEHRGEPSHNQQEEASTIDDQQQSDALSTCTHLDRRSIRTEPNSLDPAMVPSITWLTGKGQSNHTSLARERRRS
jgi:hypothetical protein